MFSVLLDLICLHLIREKGLIGMAGNEFLAEDNVCGQNLLQIVAVGNAIIAEILRVKDYIPEIFK